MSSANNTTFKIGDLLKISLGSEELTNNHLNILEAVFLVLLQKLNCHNEVVKIKGLTAQCLKKLLNDSSRPQYKFQLKNVQKIQEKYDLLEELERKAQNMNKKMEQHFQQIRKCNKIKQFDIQKWTLYTGPTEDLCNFYSKENKEYTFLAENSIFNIELRKRVMPRVSERFKKFEHRIETMQNQLQEITQIADKTTEKLKCVESVIKDVENMRSFINSREKDFRETISEVEDMLSCKLHRVTIPALKLYLEKQFANANERLRLLKLGTKKCAVTKPLLIEDKKICLSCSCHQDLDFEKKFRPLKSIVEDKKCSCCNLLKDQQIGKKINSRLSLNREEQNGTRKNSQILQFSDIEPKKMAASKPVLKNPENQKTCSREKEGCK